MQTLYLDIFSGISGDMLLGALMDLGASPRDIECELRKLRLEGYRLKFTRRHKASIEGVKVDVLVRHEDSTESPADAHPVQKSPDAAPASAHSHDHTHAHGPRGTRSGHGESRDFTAIKHMIESSELDPWVRDSAVRVFHRIAVAEGKVHGMPPEKVHFHEVGAIDSIVDIVGCCIALHLLGCPEVHSGPVVEGTGFVMCAHGRFPIPTTATLEILGARGVPIGQCLEPFELVTPTGAALLAEFSRSFGPMRDLVPKKIGYGLGTRDLESRPNVLRAVLAESESSISHGTAMDWETDKVVLLETNLDDVSGQVLGHLLDKALRKGALDVYHTSIHMKKNRPGIVLSILCAEEQADELCEFLLTETTAFGVRRATMERRKLRREWVTVATPYGSVRVKVGRLNGRCVQAAPEFADCEKIAAQAGVPVRVVHQAAIQAGPTLEA